MAALTVTLAAAVAVTGIRLDRAAAAAARVEEPVYLPRAEYLRPMSLGWQNALADVLWFRTISYFGTHYRSDRTYPWLARMCDLVTDLDPRAEHVYRFGGLVLPWEADQTDAGIRLLEKGTRAVPESWYLQFLLGFESYLFKDDHAAALAHLRRALELPGAHPSLAGLVAVVAAKEYGPETTLSFLDELERETESADMRALIGEKRRETQLAINLSRLAAAAAEYRERTGRWPATVEELVADGVLASVPPNPFGGSYTIDQVDGSVASSVGTGLTGPHQSEIRRKAALGESTREL